MPGMPVRSEKEEISLAGAVVRARKRLRRSQRVMAEETGLGRATIQRVERGARVKPSTRLMFEVWLLRNG